MPSSGEKGIIRRNSLWTSELLRIMPRGLKPGCPKPPGSGRKAGTPNKVTVDMREVMRKFVETHGESLTAWLTSIEDPAKRMDMFFRALEIGRAHV